MNRSANPDAGARIRAYLHEMQRAVGWRLDAFLSSGVFQNAALLYRRLLPGVVFIGVTGSCGKSSTKELIAAMLAKKYKVHKTPGNENQPRDIAKVLFTIPPGGGQCCVMELTPAGYHGTRLEFEIPLRLVSPRIGVVTNIGSDHIKLFGSEDAIAAEKGKLIAALPKDGVAVLNADDARVLAMRERCAGSVITYGLAIDATVRAENVSSRWPARLSFTVVHNGRSQHVQTQFCGAHWVHSVLAAFAVGIALDMSVAAIVQAVEETPPFDARMSPVELPNGVTFIRDDVKAPLWTIPAALQFMRDATAKRKIIIIGSISDYIGNSNRAYVVAAKEALEIADHVIFIGTRASKCLKAKRHVDDDALQAFYSVDAAQEYLRDLLRPGDLVLLKGTHKQDHLVDVIAIVANETGAERKAPNERVAQARGVEPPAGQTAHSEASEIKPVRAIIGLGNAGEQYRNTRHNVGFHALDALARTWGGAWQDCGLGEVASVECQGRTIFLVKPHTEMNNSGVVVKQLADQLRFNPEECILVHDDIQLPPGRIRNPLRMSGGDGGHNGVRSVHQAFQTDAIRRLKIGVGMPNNKDALADHVLRALSASELAVMDRAYVKAAEQLGKMMVGSNNTLAQANISPVSEPARNVS